MMRTASALLLACLFCGAMNSTAEANGSNAIPLRKDIPTQYKWKLEAIYANQEDWEKDFQKVKEMLPSLEKYKGRLGESAATLLECLQLRDEIAEISGKLYVYAYMRSHEDTSNTTYQALTDRVTALSVQADSSGAYIVPEILALPEGKLEQFLVQEKKLQLYKFYLEETLRQKKHILSAREEEIIARMGEVAQSPETIYSFLTNADLKFPYIKDEKGQEQELSEERYAIFIRSQDRRVRQDAFHGLFGTYQSINNTLGATFNASVKKDTFYSQIRNYPSALEAALDSDNIPTKVYDNVVDTINNNLEPLHRYMHLKKKALGIKELHMYDLYVPLIGDVQKKIPYEEGKEIVLEGLTPLGKDYNQILQKGMTEGWIDVYENQGKRKGAYSWGTYGTQPYVLLNYTDTFNDVFTLAHELGHSLHSYYSHKNQPFIYSGYTIFLAEVASTTNEALLMDYLLKKTTDKKEKLYLLNHYLEQIRTTVYRQAMFAEFEKLVHAQAERGEPLTPDGLSALWHKLNVKYYGPEMVVDPEVDIEWARIPHFYSAFYVFKYVTGYAAATSLSRQILQEGQPAKDRYLQFLTKGSSEYSIDILKEAGVDMTSAKPLEDTIKVFSEKLDQLEKLLQE